LTPRPGSLWASSADILTFGDASGYNPAWTAIPNGTAAVAISGPGIVQVYDGSDVTLAGDNSGFSGQFQIDAASTLRISAAQNLGTAAIEDNGTFNAIASSDWQLDNLISGTGTVLKTGTGILTLTGANTYTGDTTVSAGTLNVTGSIASSGMTTVDTDATLTGTGTVGNATIATGGHFMPGNGTPGSSMTVVGDLTLQTGAQYVVNIDPATSSLANVSGTATLGGLRSTRSMPTGAMWRSSTPF